MNPPPTHTLLGTIDVRRYKSWHDWFNAITDAVGSLLGSSTYTVTNVTPDRSYDANATTVDEVADVLGTLIADLKTKGILS